MSDSNSASSPTEFLVKRRHPLERVLVWSLIAGLFVLAFVETWSRYSYQRAYDFLGNRLEFGDEHGVDALDAADVQDFLDDRKPSRTEDFILSRKSVSNGATHLEVYSWFTLNPVHRREMFVYYDVHGPARKEHPQVLAIQAAEDEFVPLLSRIETQQVNRNTNEGSGRNADASSQTPRFPGMKPWGGRGGRPRGSNRAVDNQAGEAGHGSQPETDTSEI